MQSVFVLDKNKEPLMPCSPARVQQLLKAGKVAVCASGSFNITTATGTPQGLHHRFFTIGWLHLRERRDGASSHS
ncbi:MAG: RRXRR domain-containing protein [Anaerolineales bacterium]|nr:RRXRR domain-containing protein [Anaerolineales bacterium]